MATRGKDRHAREERERARLYEARRELHRGQVRRRVRDNLVAGIVGGVLVLGLVAAQTAYFVAGPGATQPSPSPTTSSTVSPEPSTTPEPSSTE